MKYKPTVVMQDENMKIIANHNMVLLLVVPCITIDAECVYYGVTPHHTQSDCREVFVKAMNNAAMLYDLKKDK